MLRVKKKTWVYLKKNPSNPNGETFNKIKAISNFTPDKYNN